MKDLFSFINLSGVFLFARSNLFSASKAMAINITKNKESITMKYVFAPTSLIIIILFSITSLFAADEYKGASAKQYNITRYDDALTKELMELYDNNPISVDWNQETIDKIQTLIHAGADPKSYLLLHFACQNNNIPLLETCLTHGADANTINPETGKTPLFSTRSSHAVQLLLKAGADISAKKIAGTADTTFTGTSAVHDITLPLEVIKTLCNNTPANPIPLDDKGRVPLHYLCTSTVPPNPIRFCQVAATLLWWSLEQKNIRDTIFNELPLNYLVRKNPHLVNYFDAIYADVQQAQATLSPLSPMSFTPPMSLEEFDQHREWIEKESLRKLLTKKLSLASENVPTNHIHYISDTIIDYAGRNTPYPIYPALSFREEEYIKPNTTYNDPLTRELNVLCHSNWNHWTQETTDKLQELIDTGANPNSFPLLYFGCLKNNIPFIKTCLTHGAEVNYVVSQEGATALFGARSCDVIQLLLDAKADVNFKKIFSRLGNIDNDHVGGKALHFTVLDNDKPLDSIELLCNHTPAEPMPVTDNGHTPLHLLCLKKNITEENKETEEEEENNKKNIQNFLQRAATLAWWRLGQVEVRNKEKKATPRDILEQTTPGLLDRFDAMIHDTQLAYTQLSSISPMLFTPPMPLKKFEQDQEQIEQQQLYELMPERLLIRGIPKMITNYTGRDTPQPLYPALAFRD